MVQDLKGTLASNCNTESAGP